MDRLTRIILDSGENEPINQVLDIENDIGQPLLHLVYFKEQDLTRRFLRFHAEVTAWDEINRIALKTAKIDNPTATEVADTSVTDMMMERLIKVAKSRKNSRVSDIPQDTMGNSLKILIMGGFICVGAIGLPGSFLRAYLEDCLRGCYDPIPATLVKAWILLVDFYLHPKNWENHRFSEPFELNLGFLTEKCLLFNYLLFNVFQRQNIDTEFLEPLNFQSEVLYLNNPNSPMEKYARSQTPINYQIRKCNVFWELLLPGYESRTDWSDFNPLGSSPSLNISIDGFPEKSLPYYKDIDGIGPLNHSDISKFLDQSYNQKGLMAEIEVSIARTLNLFSRDITTSSRAKIIIAAVLQQLTVPDFYKFISD